jgi:4a-hydroxytetrahydrobiopterin dehydratase
MRKKLEDLIASKCVPCEGNVPPLNVDEVESYLKILKDGWRVINNRAILKSFSFVNYKHTIDFVNKVAAIAEEEGHHPVLHVHFAKVSIEIWTHAINGLSENDFILAAKIDLI